MATAPSPCYIRRMPNDAPGSGGATLFEALIVPHRSLSRRGMRLVAAGFAACFGLIALRFWLLHAWPVVGFSVVEIAAVVFLLYLNARRARASELVLLGEADLRVIRTDPSGRQQERVLSAAWLRVILLEEAGRIPRLILRSRSGHEEVGQALGETEKRDLAEALRRAVHEMHNPSFDNPQLRD
jgi:uncharacterized membrane protein